MGIACGIEKDAVVSEKYKSDLEKVEANLKAIETEVVNQYKKYTLDAYTQKGGAYETAKEPVTKSLNTIIEKNTNLCRTIRLKWN